MSESYQNILMRKDKLEKAISKLDKRLREYRKEFEEICTAINVMQKYGLASGEPNYLPDTIGEMAIEILKSYPNGLTANDILEKIQSKWMPNLMRSSLSPPLSRLRKKREIDLEGEIWRLPIKATDEDFISLDDEEEIQF